MTAATMQVAMARILPLSLSGKMPRLTIARTAPRAILRKVTVIGWHSLAKLTAKH
jgi:hypothetical protein